MDQRCGLSPARSVERGRAFLGRRCPPSGASAEVLAKGLTLERLAVDKRGGVDCDLPCPCPLPPSSLPLLPLLASLALLAVVALEGLRDSESNPKASCSASRVSTNSSAEAEEACESGLSLPPSPAAAPPCLVPPSREGGVGTPNTPNPTSSLSSCDSSSSSSETASIRSFSSEATLPRKLAKLTETEGRRSCVGEGVELVCEEDGVEEEEGS